MIILGLRSSLVWLILIILAHTFNSYLVKVEIGDLYTVQVGRLPSFISGLIFILSMFSSFYLLYNLLGKAYDKMKEKSHETDVLKKNIENKNNILEKYFNTITDLYNNEFYANKSADNLYSAICWSVANSIEINRVSIWFFDKEKTCIERAFLLDSAVYTNEKVSLHECDFPNYFKAIKEKKIISATDAFTHLHTKEFKDAYLLPNQIYSMLDCPIFLDSKIIGVICCENKWAIKEWKIEDTIFLQSLSDFISIHFKNEQISDLMKEVKQQNLELFERSNEIEAMNEELNTLIDELHALNGSLEDKVNIRTNELKIQNEHLSEYAFINSHLLRAPIARMLGLANLIKLDKNLANDLSVIESLVSSTKEVDDIVKKISDILYTGKNPTRVHLDKFYKSE